MHVICWFWPANFCCCLLNSSLLFCANYYMYRLLYKMYFGNDHFSINSGSYPCNWVVLCESKYCHLRSENLQLFTMISVFSDPHTNSSNENVYDICSTIKDTPPLQRQNRSGSRNSHTLPRSSGSLPSNSIKPNIAQSPTMTSRRSRTSGMQSFDANFSDLSSDADVYLTAEDVRTEDNIVEDSVYQTIDHQTEASSVKREPKPKKHHLGSKAWAGKAKLRLGPSRKARPLSAFVDNIRHGLQNVSF